MASDAQISVAQPRMAGAGDGAGAGPAWTAGPPWSVSAADVEAAAARLTDVVRRTPLERDERLSDELGLDVWLKREDLQVTRSYKLRGAFNLMVQLGQAERDGGVVCASAGNHAQGVALSCRRLGIHGRIFLPRTTPHQKSERIAALGGPFVTVIMTGDSFDEASAAAVLDAAEHGWTMVPPFEDVRTIAGQGTVALEAVDQLGSAPAAIVVPVGGGGLIAGIGSWVHSECPLTRLVGAEPAGAASMRAALDAGTPVTLPTLDTFVDGAAVRRVGEITFGLVHDLIDEMVTVDEGAICTEMLELYQVDGIIAEPAGALATAALKTLHALGTAEPRHAEPRRAGAGAGAGAAPGAGRPAAGAAVICILSGGNNDVSRYGEVLERSLVHRGLKHYFLVDFPQEPGALRRFLDEVLGPDDDITLFEYVKKSNRESGPALVGIELVDRSDLDPLLERMAASRLQMQRVPPGSPLFTFLL